MVGISYFGNEFFSSTQEIDLFFNGGYQINSYIIAAAIFLFAKYYWKEEKENWLYRKILILGSFSFSIYCSHAIILEKLIQFTKASHVIELVLLSIPTMIIGTLIAWILSKIKQLKITNGKF